MGGIQRPHLLQQISAPPSTNVTTSSVNVTTRLLVSLLCMRKLAPRSVAGGHKGTNPEQFMFGISVIESHSYIKGRKWGCKCKVGVHENIDLSHNVFFFYSLLRSPLSERWMINSQRWSQQQLLADRPDMRIAA